MNRNLSVAALAVLVCASLGAALFGGFVWDDGALIVDNSLIKSPSGLATIMTSGFWETGDRHDRFQSFFRPVVSLSYAFDYAVWGLRPAGFHLTNLLLHFLCCWLVYRVCTAEAVPWWAALGGAAIFAVHPVHVESVAWISGRTDLLCAFFLLASFMLSRREGRRAQTMSLSLFALALFSKEMAATLPLLVFFDRLLSGGGIKRNLRSAWTGAWPYLAVLGLYLAVRWLVLAHGAAQIFEMSAASYAATALFVVARYLMLLIMPVGLDAHYPYEPLTGLLVPIALLAMLMLAVVFVATRPLSRNSPRGLFWLGWVFASMLPVLVFSRLGGVLMADRFLYIPSIALAPLMAMSLRVVRAGERPFIPKRPVAVTMALILVIFASLSVRRSLVWRDDYTLFTDMARTSPHSALVRCNLGSALYARGESARAVEEFRAAIALSPSYSLAHNNLATALESEGRLEEALAGYREALRLAPGLVEAGANAGSLLVRSGRHEEGLTLLQELLELHPRSTIALYALADALDRVGRGEEALPLLERALRYDPRHAESHYLTGKIHSDRGRTEEAASSMSRFLELWDEEGEHAEAARRIVEGAASGE
jgi:Flp pilus assembly protein TadD